MLDPGGDWLAGRLLTWIPLLLSLAVHEWAHAFCAFQLGDDTAARLGRMTLNPLAHIDPIGTVALPLLGVPFGWAKPVPVNPVRFRREVRMGAGMALAAAAGPLSNFAVALLAVALLAAGAALAPGLVLDGSPLHGLLTTLALINAALGVFNLIPIPPLDGSRIADVFVPERLRPAWHGLEAYAPLALAALLVGPAFLGVSLFAWALGPVQQLLRAVAP
jgi:Zn-dependent protease